MRQYSATGYAVQDLPEVTQNAILKWVMERERILKDFGRFFADDAHFHPYQICISEAHCRLSALRANLQNTFPKAEAKNGGK